MTYEESKKEAARKTHQWIKDHRDHFINIAEELKQLHLACEEDYNRLNKPLSAYTRTLTVSPTIDRLVHHSVILELNVPSYRAEQARKRKNKDV